MCCMGTAEGCGLAPGSAWLLSAPPEEGGATLLALTAGLSFELTDTEPYGMLCPVSNFFHSSALVKFLCVVCDCDSSIML